MLLKISIDSGKHSTKCFLKDKEGNDIRDMFPTKINETEEIVASALNSYVVSMGDSNERFMLGTAGEDFDYSTNKAINLHKYAIYTMIHKYALNNQRVELVVGCPLSIFHNVDTREKYAEFIMGGKNIKFTVNGETKHFVIEKIKVVPEGSGFLLKNSDVYENRLVGIVDIGGLNLNGCVYDKLVPDKTTYFTENKGSHILTNDLKTSLNEEYGAELPDFIMPKVLEDGYLQKNPDESKKFIKNFYKGFIQSKIKNSMKKKGWVTDYMDIVFVGGGSSLLNDYIRNEYPEATIADDAQWENVEGAYVLLI